MCLSLTIPTCWGNSMRRRVNYVLTLSWTMFSWVVRFLTAENSERIIINAKLSRKYQSNVICLSLTISTFERNSMKRITNYVVTLRWTVLGWGCTFWYAKKRQNNRNKRDLPQVPDECDLSVADNCCFPEEFDETMRQMRSYIKLKYVGLGCTISNSKTQRNNRNKCDFPQVADDVICLSLTTPTCRRNSMTWDVSYVFSYSPRNVQKLGVCVTEILDYRRNLIGETSIT